MSNAEVTQGTDEQGTTELTDEAVAELFSVVGDKLSTIVVGRFDEDLSIGAELAPMLREHGVSTHRVAAVLDLPQSYVSRIVRAADAVAEWNAALPSRKNVDKCGLVAIYRKGRRQVSCKGLNDFVAEMVAYTTPTVVVKLTGQKLINAKVAEATKALNKVLDGLTPAQRAKVMVALLGE